MPRRKRFHFVSQKGIDSKGRPVRKRRREKANSNETSSKTTLSTTSIQTTVESERQEAPEVMYEMHCEQEKRSSAETPEITTPELAMDRTIKTEVESDYETDGCIKTESFFEAEDDPLIEVKTEILDIKTELESSEPRFISRATSVSPDHMHGSRNLINEQIDKHKNRIKVLEQIRLRQSKKIKELENLLQYYTNK